MKLKNLSGYNSGAYWRERSDMLYYRYLDYILRAVGRDAKSLADVGTGGCAYLEWFEWIPERVSYDIAKPYESESVKGVNANILDMKFPEKYDICTCLQVLEHIPEVEKFARKLSEIGKLVVVSVPYKWPANKTPGHIHDPVTYKDLCGWMGREANYKIIVKEPFRGDKGERLIALFDEDENKKFGGHHVKNRIIR